VSRPRLLDLFCGAGGATRGYQLAGWHVTGVDHILQPHYCGDEFVLSDALLYIDGWQAWARDYFDAIHASPPCPRYTSMQSVARNADAHPDLIGDLRELLNETGLTWVIENVPGAPLHEPFQLCGSSFGLGTDYFLYGKYEQRQLRRHRLFETNWPIGLVPPCAHRGKTVGIYGDHLRFGRRSTDGEVSGPQALAFGCEAMGVGWPVTWAELKDMVPPAYTEYIGAALIMSRQDGRRVITA
jgi:DNA (cytosine-5)-methyltransferase 1